ncbi:hypothetical protein D9M68_887010 [compost metagenome]
MRSIYQRLCDSRVYTRQTYIEARPEEVDIVGLAQVHFGIDGQVGGEGNLQLCSGLSDCADEAG